MKNSKTRIAVIAIMVISISLIAFKLRSNKNEFNEELTIAQRTVESIAVTVYPVNSGTISKNVSATGVLEASEVLTLASETQGKIVKIYKEKGDRVSAGDVIVKVDDEVIAANVLTAESNHEQFEKDLERFTRLSAENAVAKHDLEQIAIGLKKAKADLITARKALSNTSIKSPISGYINNEFITVGQLLGGGSPVCEIVNNSTLKLNIKITEHEVYKIKTGQTVSVYLTAFPDEKFTGRITSIAEKADMAMKFNVEIALNNDATNHLRSGLYAEVELPVRNEEKLIIQKSAIVGSMIKPVVFIANNGKAEKREVVIGQSNENQTEVISGLVKGDLVIVSGQLNVKHGDDVKIIK